MDENNEIKEMLNSQLEETKDLLDNAVDHLLQTTERAINETDSRQRKKYQKLREKQQEGVDALMEDFQELLGSASEGIEDLDEDMYTVFLANRQRDMRMYDTVYSRQMKKETNITKKFFGKVSKWFDDLDDQVGSLSSIVTALNVDTLVDNFEGRTRDTVDYLRSIQKSLSISDKDMEDLKKEISASAEDLSKKYDGMISSSDLTAAIEYAVSEIGIRDHDEASLVGQQLAIFKNATDLEYDAIDEIIKATNTYGWDARMLEDLAGSIKAMTSTYEVSDASIASALETFAGRNELLSQGDQEEYQKLVDDLIKATTRLENSFIDSSKVFDQWSGYNNPGDLTSNYSWLAMGGIDLQDMWNDIQEGLYDSAAESLMRGLANLKQQGQLDNSVIRGMIKESTGMTEEELVRLTSNVQADYFDTMGDEMDRLLSESQSYLETRITESTYKKWTEKLADKIGLSKVGMAISNVIDGLDLDTKDVLIGGAAAKSIAKGLAGKGEGASGKLLGKLGSKAGTAFSGTKLGSTIASWGGKVNAQTLSEVLGTSMDDVIATFGKQATYSIDDVATALGTSTDDVYKLFVQSGGKAAKAAKHSTNILNKTANWWSKFGDDAAKVGKEATKAASGTADDIAKAAAQAAKAGTSVGDDVAKAAAEAATKAGSAVGDDIARAATQAGAAVGDDILKEGTKVAGKGASKFGGSVMAALGFVVDGLFGAFKTKDWFGEEAKAGDYVSSTLGSVVGGTGSGWFGEGKWWEKLLDTASGALKYGSAGAAIGSAAGGIGAIPGAIIGALTGVVSSAIGGENFAKGFDLAGGAVEFGWDWLTDKITGKDKNQPSGALAPDTPDAPMEAMARPVFPDEFDVPAHKQGLDYVPYDDYLAKLHKGERVLTADENKNYSGITDNRIEEAVKESLVDQNTVDSFTDKFIERAIKTLTKKLSQLSVITTGKSIKGGSNSLSGLFEGIKNIITGTVGGYIIGSSGGSSGGFAGSTVSSASSYNAPTYNSPAPSTYSVSGYTAPVEQSYNTVNNYKVESAGSNEQTIYKFLKNQIGLNSAASSGVLSNVFHESSFNPNALGDSGTSYGICQWHNTRWDDLKNFCNQYGYDYTTLEGQLNFLGHELKTNYSGLYSALASVSDDAEGAYQAAAKWCTEYERPADMYTRAAERGLQAQNYFDKYIGMYEKGTPWVPNDQIAMIHKGEMIVPSKYNPVAESRGETLPTVKTEAVSYQGVLNDILTVIRNGFQYVGKKIDDIEININETTAGGVKEASSPVYYARGVVL